MLQNFAIRVFALFIVYHTSYSHAIGVVGGIKTTIEQHPYIASLQLANGTHLCSGAVIDSKRNIIVTAAQCLIFNDPTQLYVRLGTGKYDSDGELIPIKSFVIHENFDFTTMDSDVAVVQLLKKLPVKGKEIKIAVEKPRTGKSAMVTGWSQRRQLENVKVRIIKAKICRSGAYVYNDEDITDTMLCAQAYNKYVCDGEPGSPLVLKGKLVGLMSWGYGCGNLGNPAVYTNVNKLRKWIKKTIKKL